MGRLDKLKRKKIESANKRILNENFFSKLFGLEDEELTQEEVENVLVAQANLDFDIYQNYRHRKRFKRLVHPMSSENEIHLDLEDVYKGDTFFEYVEPVRNYLENNGGKVQLDKYNFTLDGDTIIINRLTDGDDLYDDIDNDGIPNRLDLDADGEGHLDI